MMFQALILLLFADSSLENVGQRSMIWVVKSSSKNQTRIEFRDGNPEVWIEELIRMGSSLATSGMRIANDLKEHDYDKASADFWTNGLVVSDRIGNYILTTAIFHPKGELYPAKHSAGTKGQPLGLAADWVNKHVYWTDPELHIIGMASYVNSGRQRIVHSSEDPPMAIAVNPLEGYLYWSTSGSTVHIRRSNLMGTDTPTSIVTRNSTVTAMIVDYSNGDLYYVDNYRKVYTCDKDGHGERDLHVWTTTATYTIADVDIYEDYLLVSAKEVQFVDVYNKTSSHYLVRIPGLDQMRSSSAISVSAPERQPQLPGNFSGCKKPGGLCSQFCVQNGRSGHYCECDFGYQLQIDGRTCVPASPVLQDNFILVGDGLNQDIYQIDLANSSTDQPSGAHVLPLTDIDDLVGITYDVTHQLVYWTSTNEAAIYEATLEGSGQRKVLQLERGVELYRLAFRSTPRRVYFTAGRSIGWFSLSSGEHENIYKAEPLQKTIALALDPRTSFMYWSECGIFNVIYTADIDMVNNKKTLVDSSGGEVLCPCDIALDLVDNKVYWTDISGVSAYYQRSVVARVNMDGTNRELLYDASATTAQLFSLALDSRMVYVTALRIRTLITVDKVSRAVGSIGYTFHGKLMCIYLHNATYSLQAGTTPATATISPTTSETSQAAGPTTVDPTHESTGSRRMLTIVLTAVGAGFLVAVIATSVICHLQKSMASEIDVPQTMMTGAAGFQCGPNVSQHDVAPTQAFIGYDDTGLYDTINPAMLNSE